MTEESVGIHRHLHFILRRAGFIAEQILILLVITAVTVDIFGFLPEDVAFFKETLSWVIVGYMIFKISPTRIFFGKKHRMGDLFLVISLFVLLLKDFAQLISVIEPEKTVLIRNFLEYMASYIPFIPFVSLFFGGLFLLIVSFIFAFRYPVELESVFGIFFSSPKPRNFIKYLLRGFLIFIMFMAFFLLIFNPLMEWFAVVLDNILLLLAILFYIYVWVRFHRKFHPGTLIYKVGSFGEDFVTKLIKLFQHKRKFFLGVVGLLGIQLAVETSIYLVPYLIGGIHPLYASSLGAGHHSIAELLRLHYHTVSEWLILLWMYLGNVFVLIFAFVFPSFLWYSLYRRETHVIPKILLGLFFAGLVCFLLAPCFVISHIDNTQQQNLIGVDIISQELVSNLPVFLLSISTLVIVFFVCEFGRIKRGLEIIATGSALVICAVSIYHFFVSAFFYYYWNIYPATRLEAFESWNITNNIIYSFVHYSNYFLSFVYAVMLVVILSFWVGGFVLYLLIIRRELQYIK